MTVNSETPDLFQALSDEALITHLCTLPEIQLEGLREPIAESRGWRVSKLDKFIQSVRDSSETDDVDSKLQGTAISLCEPDPWPDPVDGAELLEELANTIGRHMVMRSVDVDTCAVWAIHTHIFDVFSHTPRLLITAPDAECGKTLLMVYLVGDLCNRPQSTELMKPAPFFRMITAHQPTFLIDEADVFLKEDVDLVAAINNGWEPHGGVHRCVGEDLEVREFSTYCPVALAGIEMHKRLKSTTISRSLIIYLDRAAENEIAKEDIYNKRKHRTHVKQLARKIARWCKDNKTAIKECEPILPDGVRNRGADKWRPLMAIAETAGGDWPDRLRVAIAKQPDIAEPTRAIQLLDDVHRIIGIDKGIHTTDLIFELGQIQDAPWSEYNFKERDLDRRLISDRQVANLLKRYGVHSDDIRMPNGVKRGYYRDKVEAAWNRYIGAESATTLQPNKNGVSSVAHENKSVADEPLSATSEILSATPEPAPDKGCSTVAPNTTTTGNTLLDDKGWEDFDPDQVQ